MIHRLASPVGVAQYNVTRSILRADTGEVVSTARVHNRVLDSGLTALWSCFSGVGPALSTFALGTDATEPTAESTGPAGEVLRSDLGLLTVAGPILTAEYYLSSAECNDLTLCSAMCLAGLTPFAWVTFPPALKTDQFVWVFQWQFPLEQIEAVV